MEIFHSPQFAREYKKLPQKIQRIAEKREKLFRQDPFYPQLNTHKLKGRLTGFWAYSLDYRFRIIFEFGAKGIVYFHSVGDHGIYD